MLIINALHLYKTENIELILPATGPTDGYLVLIEYRKPVFVNRSEYRGFP